MEFFKHYEGLVGFIGGALTILAMGKWIIGLFIENWTAQLVAKFDERYPSQSVFEMEVARLNGLDARVLNLERRIP